MYGAPAAYGQTAEELAQEAFAESGQYLEALKGRLKEQGAGSVKLLAVKGSPAEAILEIAQETPNSLVAMTTHGRSGIGRWVMGSVADRVIRYSDGPVLLVRGKE